MAGASTPEGFRKDVPSDLAFTGTGAGGGGRKSVPTPELSRIIFLASFEGSFAFLTTFDEEPDIVAALFRCFD